ncbi:hypothetical protein T484DRAFT_1832767, partial [Baffinella frigidus]
THKNGWLSIVSFDYRRDRLQATHREQFFQTDARRLEVDAQSNVIDREAQLTLKHVDAQSNVIDREAQLPPHLVPQVPSPSTFNAGAAV